MRTLTWTLGLLAIGLGTALAVAPSPTGAVVGTSAELTTFWSLILVVGGVLGIAVTGLEERISPYHPKLSTELRDKLTREGTLQRFLTDYERLCTGFRPPRLYLADKGETPLHYETLTVEQREELEKLGKSYAHALHHLLEIALRFDKAKTRYAVIGGFGVYGHLGKDKEDRTSGFRPTRWRGTEDIDILTETSGSAAYRAIGLAPIAPERVNTEMIPDGRMDTYLGQNPYHDRPIKVQERHTIALPSSKKTRGGRKDISRTVLDGAQEVRLYGVPLKVASREVLVGSKRGIRARKDKLGTLKDAHDLTHLDLLSKLEGQASGPGR